MFFYRSSHRLVFALFLVATALAAVPASAADEIRGWWVDAFNLGFRTSSQVTQLIADARAAKINALFIQVRKRGDAFYNSNYEPKAAEVSPGSFDPLADLLTKARTGGARIDIHAWVVTYNIWNNSTTIPSQSTHPYRLHPDWLTRKNDGSEFDGANYAFDQAHPAVQEYTYNVCMDILSRYSVDGLHFDYIRYTDDGASTNSQPWGYHPVAVSRFQQITGRTDTPLLTDSQWLQFRRDQVSALVRRVYLNGYKVRKSARISAALIAYTGPPTSQTTTAWRARDAYSKVLQDWRSWLQEGILDTGIPMVYRDGANATRAAEFLAWRDWAQQNQFSRAICMGQGTYLNSSLTNTLLQLKSTRVTTAPGQPLAGVVFYSYAGAGATPVTRPDFINALTDDVAAEQYDPGGNPLFADTATIPAMPWKSSATTGHAMGRLATPGGAWLDGGTLTLSGPAARTLTTDANGFWGAVDLPAGTYAATIQQPGYLPYRTTFTVAAGNIVESPTFTLTEQPLNFSHYVWNPTTRVVNLTWYSRPGSTYRVETGSQLSSWTTLASGVAAQGWTTSWTSTQQAAANRRFFRVVRE